MSSKSLRSEDGNTIIRQPHNHGKIQLERGQKLIIPNAVTVGFALGRELPIRDYRSVSSPRP